jgi:hypothetical protein
VVDESLMTPGDSLYENPVSPSAVHSGTRIFAPPSYRTVRESQTCAIVHTEALNLAAFYPICWIPGGRRPTLVALRSLMPGGHGHLRELAQMPSTLPLSLQAYPFVAEVPAGHDEGESPILFDDVIADEPTDTGSPILTAQGKLTRGAETRLRAAAFFRSDLALTERITDELVGADCLVPWIVEPKALPPGARVPDMLVVGPVEKVSDRLFQVIKRLGPVGGIFLGAHRLSLFRIGGLVQAANGAGKMASAA